MMKRVSPQINESLKLHGQMCACVEEKIQIPHAIMDACFSDIQKLWRISNTMYQYPNLKYKTK